MLGIRYLQLIKHDKLRNVYFKLLHLKYSTIEVF